MRMNTILALAAANIVAAQRSNNGTNPDNGGGVNGFPGRLGQEFRLYGCVRSDNGFPTFRRVSMMPDMDLDFCAASCDTKYMGVHDTDCYCGTEIDDTQSTRVDLNSCDIDCPGNADEKCGGFLLLGKRQNVPTNVLLTVYVREGEPDTTSTVTETSTSIGTITSCPPEVTNCPVGKKTMSVMTITSTYPCPEATPDYQKIVCYGDECVAETTCDTCSAHRVVCRDGHCWVENCDSADHNRLVICEGDKCEYATGQQGKVVCYGNTCDIQECYSDECKAKVVNHDTCTDQCPTPAPPAATPAPPCYGPGCQIAPPKSNNGTVPPVAAGADNVLPAAGAVFGIVAGFAALL